MDKHAAPNPFEIGLDRHPANFVPLSPLSFLRRAAGAFERRVAVIDGGRRITYGDLYQRCARLASGLAARGIGRLDTVAILAPKVPEMIEAHYAVPMLGAVLNPLNTRPRSATRRCWRRATRSMPGASRRTSGMRSACFTRPAPIRFCRECMARFKVPKRVVFGPIPKTSTGKVQKFTLREQARELQRSDRRYQTRSNNAAA